MYEVRVKDGFAASHQLRMYDGQLEPLHGHDWEVEAEFRGPELDRIGVLIDFVAVQRALKELIALVHHRHLNESPIAALGNPSAENVARWFFDQLHERLGSECALAAVHVKEAPGCVASYRVGDP